jgi:hypothetical protein
MIETVPGAVITQQDAPVVFIVVPTELLPGRHGVTLSSAPAKDRTYIMRCAHLD